MVYDPRPDSADITVMFPGNDHPTDVPKSEIIIITEMIDNEAGARFEKERRERLLADRAASALACLAAAEQQPASPTEPLINTMATAALKDFTPSPVARPPKPAAPPKPAVAPEKKPFWKR
ncbi:MAG TPA: hypothetical protein VNU68_09820 [Verrucomicrobiae bacterium]|nr:hypothetical protein [Verrucomicrobiae bacterium]